MSPRTCIATFMLVFSAIALFPQLASAEEEPNDSLIDPQGIGEGTFEGSVSGDDIDVYRIDVGDDTMLFLSLEKTDSLFGNIDLDTYDEYRERTSEPAFHTWTPGETMRDYISVHNATTFYFEVFGNGTYVLKTHLVDHDYTEAITEIELGTVNGSVGTIRWEGLEVVDEDYFIFYPEGSTDFTLTKVDGGQGTIKLTLDLGYGEYKEIDVSVQGGSETISISTWDVYYDYVEISIEGEGNYTLEVSESDPFEGMEEFLCCFAIFMLVSIVAFFGLLVLIVVVAYRATKKKDGKEGDAPSQDLPPSMRPPRTARTPPPPSG